MGCRMVDGVGGARRPRNRRARTATVSRGYCSRPGMKNTSSSGENRKIRALNFRRLNFNKTCEIVCWSNTFFVLKLYDFFSYNNNNNNNDAFINTKKIYKIYNCFLSTKDFNC